VSGLSHVADIPAHSGTISDVQFPFDSLPQALYSCSRDGHVKAWDLRSRQLAERYAVTAQAELVPPPAAAATAASPASMSR
jgi:WD40 repeat protein